MSTIQSFSDLEKQFKSALSLVAPWSDEAPKNDPSVAEEGVSIIGKRTFRDEFPAQNHEEENEVGS
jgi:hypothetical protein